MGTIRRQSIQASLILLVGLILGFLLRLYLFPKYLSPDEIGLLTVLLDTANLFATFIPLGSKSIFVKYLPYFQKDEDSPKGLLFLGVTISIIGFLIFLAVFFIFQAPLQEYYAKSTDAKLFSRYLIFLVPLVLFRVIYILGWGYSRALKKNVFNNFIKEIIVRVLTACLIIGYAYHLFDLDGMIFLYVTIYFISGAIMTYYIFRLGELKLQPRLDKLKHGKGKEIFYFGLFAVMTGAGSIILRSADSLLITSLKGTYAAGIYSVAFFIGLVIELPRRSISQITGPFIAEAAESNNTKQIASLYHKSSINQFLVGSIMLICVWINIDDLFALIPKGNIYQEGKYVVLFIGLGKLFDMSMGVNNEIIQNSPHYRFNFYTMTLLAFLGVITNILLIPILGIEGAAIASLISIFLVNTFKGVFIKYRFGLQPFGKNSLLALLISVIAYLFALILPSTGYEIINVLYKSFLTTLLFIGLAYSLSISTDINQLIRKTLKPFK